MTDTADTTQETIPAGVPVAGRYYVCHTGTPQRATVDAAFVTAYSQHPQVIFAYKNLVWAGPVPDRNPAETTP